MAGRPRKRSIEDALDRAIEVFWTHGYESTSISDLSQALGVGPSSLYNTFGSKEAFFTRAMERYVERDSDYLHRALDQPDTIDALCTVLHASAAHYTRAHCPPGCAVLSTPRQCRPGSEVADQLLKSFRARTIQMIQTRIQRGIEEGDLDASTDAESLARFVVATMQGMSAQARDGATQATLEALALYAIRTLRSLTQS